MLALMHAAKRPPATPVERRRIREREIVDSTRRLFDERGMRDAPMDEIAQGVNINRALIYRYFDSKDELFVLTMTRYLEEITARGLECIDSSAPAEVQLRASWGSFASYCLEYPAFLDCALSLMSRPAEELRASLSDTTWTRLATTMSDCLDITIEILRRGTADGVFAVEDPAFATNCLYAQTIGLLHLARLGVGVARSPSGSPEAFPVQSERVHAACIHAALAAAGCRAALSA